jgi:alpha-ketoglutarate-dependent 2,4-dichlorophenoxyacetate dioxygenase
MAFDIRPLHPLFGAELRADPASTDPATIKAIEAAAGRYGLVLLRDAALDDAGLVRFAARFGPLQTMANFAGDERHVVRVTNIGADGGIKPEDDDGRRLFDANLHWHVDSSFMAPGATFSFLHARIVPNEGGDTQFCDNRATWDALDPEQKDRLSGLAAIHSLAHSRKLTGYDLADPSAVPSVRRRLVRHHWPSGRNALILASHVERIDGIKRKESTALLADLTALATAPERIYSHRWRAGDLLVWDNRCIMHRATPFASLDEPRDLRSARVIDVEDDGLIAGAGSTVAAQR